MQKCFIYSERNRGQWGKGGPSVNAGNLKEGKKHAFYVDYLHSNLGGIVLLSLQLYVEMTLEKKMSRSTQTDGDVKMRLILFLSSVEGL